MSTADVRPSRRGPALSARWTVRLVLALLLLVQGGIGAALSSSDPGPAPAAPTAACQHGAPAHDVLCGPAHGVVGAAQRLAPRDRGVLAVGAAVAVLLVGLLVAPSSRRGPDGPPWARRRAPVGRHLLQSLGIVRV
ncbi:hypothetical protein [Pseudonocardia xinjiangensis]|uniref:MYXO-CTERM domain-containing protein n=1 Tax=Pseudonocardia xinjiangensis TaxID=75289 RepID=A0ABX1RE98_9PSEU|nr:hypothetical protein [Pseudonocardia xinjiangensis]NMH77558.1 hypothetical protein [Pseudonocardia xinjiangensis]